jgi:hypothetical protein
MRTQPSCLPSRFSKPGLVKNRHVSVRCMTSRAIAFSAAQINFHVALMLRPLLREISRVAPALAVLLGEIS